MIDAKVINDHVQIKAAGTGAELAGDVLKMINALYEDILEHDTCMKLSAASFRTTIMLLIEDVLEYEKLEVKIDDLQKP